MLKGIDPLLTPDLLYVLAAMGHGDDLVLCDANFPAVSCARTTTHGAPIVMAGLSVPAVARAILSVLPLDTAVETPVLRMEVHRAPTDLPDVQSDLLSAVGEADERDRHAITGSLDRFSFYEAARRSYAIVWTGEPRFYGCFILKKGVIAPE